MNARYPIFVVFGTLTFSAIRNLFPQFDVWLLGTVDEHGILILTAVTVLFGYCAYLIRQPETKKSSLDVDGD